MGSCGFSEKIIVMGVGEIGGVMARSFLRAGHPVFPLGRNSDIRACLERLVDPLLVLVSVGEKDLHAALQSLPIEWRDRVVLIQNELLPGHWQRHNLVNPTVMSVWFEKKKGQDVRVVVPSPVFGPHAELLKGTLNLLDIPVVEIVDEEDMLFELIRKNLYILVTNLCGLSTGGTVAELWSKHRLFARSVAEDVLSIQSQLVGRQLDAQSLIASMLTAFEGDPDHKCLGRTASQRLRRAVETGDRYALDIPVLRQLLRENP